MSDPHYVTERCTRVGEGSLKATCNGGSPSFVMFNGHNCTGNFFDSPMEQCSPGISGSIGFSCEEYSTKKLVDYGVSFNGCDEDILNADGGEIYSITLELDKCQRSTDEVLKMSYRVYYQDNKIQFIQYNNLDCSGKPYNTFQAPLNKCTLVKDLPGSGRRLLSATNRNLEEIRDMGIIFKTVVEGVQLESIGFQDIRGAASTSTLNIVIALIGVIMTMFVVIQ